MIFLLSLLVSTSSFAADWQCGKFMAGATPRLELDSDNYYKYQLVAANEGTDDMVKSFKGERMCVKGNQLAGIKASLLIYDAKAE
jgi:hypothetical protein